MTGKKAGQNYFNAQAHHKQRRLQSLYFWVAVFVDEYVFIKFFQNIKLAVHGCLYFFDLNWHLYGIHQIDRAIVGD